MTFRVRALMTSVLLCSTAASASVQRIPFSKLLESSDLVVIADVAEITGDPKQQIATLKPRRVLKGTAEESLKVWVSSTWTCDITSARVGDAALFFLGAAKPEGFRMVVDAGRGLMALNEKAQPVTASLWAKDVWVPLEVRFRDGADPEASGPSEVVLDDLVALIEGRPTGNGAQREHFTFQLGDGPPQSADTLRCQSRRRANLYSGCSFGEDARGPFQPARGRHNVLCRPGKRGARLECSPAVGQ